MGSNANDRDDLSHAVKEQLAGWLDYSRKHGCRETPVSTANLTALAQGQAAGDAAARE